MPVLANFSSPLQQPAIIKTHAIQGGFVETANPEQAQDRDYRVAR